MLIVEKENMYLIEEKECRLVGNFINNIIKGKDIFYIGGSF